MENDIQLLDKQYVVEHGVDFDEKLWFTSYSDEVLDNPEDKGGKPFTGLAYELHDNGNLAYYCFYKNGFMEGNHVTFHQNGRVKSFETMVKGQTKGLRINWYDSGELKFEGNYQFGVCLTFTEWDKAGNILQQKSSPTETDLALITRFSERAANESV